MGRMPNWPEWVTRVAADGVGLMFDLVGETLVCGVDLDTCRDPISGAIEPWAQAVIDRFATYAEVSPSKRASSCSSPSPAPISPRLKPSSAEPTSTDACSSEPTAGGILRQSRSIRGHRYFTVTKDALNGVDAFNLVSVDDLEWLFNHGQKFVGPSATKASQQSNDKSRSAKAFRAGRN